MSSSRLLLETLKTADGGVVTVDVQTTFGRISGTIERSFFEDFMGAPNPSLSPARRAKIVEDNIAWFEAEADRQMRMGQRAVVIR